MTTAKPLLTAAFRVVVIVGIFATYAVAARLEHRAVVLEQRIACIDAQQNQGIKKNYRDICSQ